ncbi:MAG TPA: 4-hydroxy-tetrahydrodipicolinate reductase [Rhodanobacteraceae bacterium]|nr:4-hydroxy-tetrahydrodipicolinate reductase [Rhodanobacteraceae bacterium]
MPSPIKLAINGANGRMGCTLQALLRDDARFELTKCVNASNEWREATNAAVVIDFSTPEGFDSALEHCRMHRIALVSGTTGLEPVQHRHLDAAATKIPVLHAANFSLGIAVLTRLLRDASAALPDWDLEIIEAHHAHKVDAPSGTALALGGAAASARGQDFDDVATYGRHGQAAPRTAGAIGFASVRAGDIVGEHTVLLAGQDERIELTHRAFDSAIFARGALTAGAWLVGRKAGRYTINDVLVAGAPR